MNFVNSDRLQNDQRRNRLHIHWLYSGMILSPMLLRFNASKEQWVHSSEYGTLVISPWESVLGKVAVQCKQTGLEGSQSLSWSWAIPEWWNQTRMTLIRIIWFLCTKFVDLCHWICTWVPHQYFKYMPDPRHPDHQSNMTSFISDQWYHWYEITSTIPPW